ncbi:MAG: hypothetical protein CW716_10735 [Candidatus Bathyarchaeum sp.]|nr:MAG: hypothetical protein CW716_10735 [Candidatus Bathyarchaeum sp.]
MRRIAFMKSVTAFFVVSLSLTFFIGTVQASSWTKVSIPNDVFVASLDMVNSTDGWAVGNDGCLLHWNGTSWTEVASPTYANLVFVDMLSSNEGYAVVRQRTSPSVLSVIRWDGISWKNMSTPRGYFNALDMVSSTDGWAVGNGGAIMHWDGTCWSRQETISYPVEITTGFVVEYNLTNPIESVDMISSTDGWAVGYRGTIVHWDGTCWSLVECPQIFASRTIWSVDMVSSTDGWAVGDGGRIIRWDGTSWNNVTSPTASHLFSLAMIDSDDGWAVGSDGAVIHWDGNEWSNATGPTGAWLFSVKMVSSTEGWVLGADGMYHLNLEKETSQIPIEYLLTIAAIITSVVVWLIIEKRTFKSTEQQ